jgi:lipoyl(octanoyl) transferase
MVEAETRVAIPVVRLLGRVEYATALDSMRAFTATRNEDTVDELWLLEHPPVYTLGQGAGAVHGPGGGAEIPVIRVDRGGEVTYHGPGQLVIYALVDIARRGLKVREYVRLLEQSVIDLLADYEVSGARMPGAPGVYVNGAKVAALGIRVTRGRAFHGLALNVAMDLDPYGAIDPCGYPGLAVTQTSDLGISAEPFQLGEELARHIVRHLEGRHA